MNPPIDWAFAYSPTNPVLNNLIVKAQDYLDTNQTIRIDSNKTAADLAKYIQADNVFVGIQFPDSWENIVELPKKLEFSLRFPSELRTNDEAMFVEIFNWFTESMFPAFQLDGPRNRERNDGGLPPG